MTVTEADHGINVVTVHLPAGNPLRAECLCGWQSPIVGSKPQALAAGHEHIDEPLGAVEIARQNGYDAGYSDARSLVTDYQLMRPAEVAEFTGMSTKTLRILRALNVGPRSIKLGSQTMYRKREVLQWISDSRYGISDPAIAADNLERAFREVKQATDGHRP